MLVAIFFKPDAAFFALAIMIAGWFVLMNIIQPRLMSEAVGLHPVVVLGSVMIGSKLAGIPGAIFGIPIAAVIASFFFYYLGHRRIDGGTVTDRAARVVEEREGRPIRVPRLPQAGEDQELEQLPVAPAVKRRSRTARKVASDPVTNPGPPVQGAAGSSGRPTLAESTLPSAPAAAETNSTRGGAKNPA